MGPLIVCREYLKEASRCMIQATFDVAFDIPPCPCPGFTDRGEGSGASSVWPETVGLLRKLWVVIGFQNGAYHFLYELI